MTITEGEEIIRAQWKRPFRITCSVEVGNHGCGDNDAPSMDYHRVWYSISGCARRNETMPSGHGENLQKAVMQFLDAIPQHPDAAEVPTK